MNDLNFILFCSIKFYKNKRKSLPNLSSGEYRPHIILNIEKDYLGFSFKHGEVNSFDEEVNCFLFPLYDEIDYSSIGIGKKFFIVEGSKKVGEGIINEILYNTNGDSEMEK